MGMRMATTAENKYGGWVTPCKLDGILCFSYCLFPLDMCMLIHVSTVEHHAQKFIFTYKSHGLGQAMSGGFGLA